MCVRSCVWLGQFKKGGTLVSSETPIDLYQLLRVNELYGTVSFLCMSYLIKSLFIWTVQLVLRYGSKLQEQLEELSWNFSSNILGSVISAALSRARHSFAGCLGQECWSYPPLPHKSL